MLQSTRYLKTNMYCRTFVFWLYCTAVINRACLGYSLSTTSSFGKINSGDAVDLRHISNKPRLTTDTLGGGHWNPIPFHEVLGKHLESKTHRCEPVTLTLCKGMYYPNTRMPNMFHHETQEEAGLEAHQFYPLVQINCSEDLRFLLCSIYTPICIDGYPGFLPPCRSICERVKAGCAPIMQHYNFPWPDRMSCDQFPEYNNPHGILCMERNLTETGPETPEHGSPQSTDKSTGKLAESTEKTFPVVKPENELDRFSAEASQMLLMVELRNKTVLDWLSRDPELNLVCQCHCASSTGNLQSQTTVTGSTSEQDGCPVPCKIPYFSEDAPHEFTNYWLTLWSTLCIISTLLTVLTFMTDAYRFQYPELPIIYLSACYFMVSLGYLIRLILGHESVACDNGHVSDLDFKSVMTTTSSSQLMSTVVPGLTTFIANPALSDANGFDRVKVLRYASSGRASCAIVFLFVYFFGMASSVWWVILTFTWFLAAGLKWGSEAISKYSQVFHFIAWSVPTTFTALALLLSVVEGDPASGLCSIGTGRLLARILFLFAPTLLFLAVGIIFLFAGFVALFRIRGVIKLQRIGSTKTDRLESLMLRIGVFGLLYAIPNVTILVCIGYELRNVRVWELGQQCQCEYQRSAIGAITLPNMVNLPTWKPPKPDYTMFLLKHFMSLIIGVTSGFWIWSHKTWNSWRLVCQGGRCFRLSGGSQCSTVRLLPNTATVDLEASSKPRLVPWIGFPSAVSMQTVNQPSFPSGKNILGVANSFPQHRTRPCESQPANSHHPQYHHLNQLPLPPVPGSGDKYYYDSVSQNNRTPSTTDQRQLRGHSVASNVSQTLMSPYTDGSDRQTLGTSAVCPKAPIQHANASSISGFQTAFNPNNWSVLSSSGISSGLTVVGNGSSPMNFDGKIFCRQINSNSENNPRRMPDCIAQRTECLDHSFGEQGSRDIYSRSSGHNSASSAFNEYPYQSRQANSKPVLSPQQHQHVSDYTGYYSGAIGRDRQLSSTAIPRDSNLIGQPNVTNDSLTITSSESACSKQRGTGPVEHPAKQLANPIEDENGFAHMPGVLKV